MTREAQTYQRDNRFKQIGVALIAARNGEQHAELLRGTAPPCTVRSRSKKGNAMKNVLMRLWKEEEGQDLTEYALLLVLISLALVGALKTLATDIATVFGNAATTLT